MPLNFLDAIIIYKDSGDGSVNKKAHCACTRTCNPVES